MDDGMISFHTREDGERYFTNADMARMLEAGLIDPDDRWELIRGAWFDMGSEGFEHMTMRTRIVREVILQIGRRPDVEISTEGSIYLFKDTEVRPDLIIYRSDVGSNEMSGADIFLIIEIMKTSQRRDRDLKMPAYASAGIPELWLVDLDAREVSVLKSPNQQAGGYEKQRISNFDLVLAPDAFPGVSLKMSDLA